ncbi:U2 small nuclear RNA auxiliary factor 2, partial [Podochytrium sp. JEL0797]
MALDGLPFHGGILKIRRPKDYQGPGVAGISLPGVVATNVGDSPQKLFVGGLPSYLNEEQVIELLKAFGDLKSFNLVKDIGTQQSKGFAFCEYANPDITDIACQGLNGMELGDKKLVVQRASIGNKATGGPAPGGYLPMLPTSLLGVGGANSGTPTKVLMLLNMVTVQELKDNHEYEDILEDIRDECGKFGEVVKVFIPRPVEGQEVPDVGKIFVEFSSQEGSGVALKALAGRKFADRTVYTSYVADDLLADLIRKMSKQIVILGGGITGVCTAYYLRLKDPSAQITIVDSEGSIAPCASGRAGGFLARDWPESPLSALSFQMHEDLANKHNGETEWLYRPVETFSVKLPARTTTTAPTASSQASWIPSATSTSAIGSLTTTAQVHPRLFCESLFLLSGATLLHATALDLIHSDSESGDRVTGIRIQPPSPSSTPTILPATHIILALGPWCDPLVREKWGIPIRRVDSMKGHSVILKPQCGGEIPAHCLFTQLGKMEGPEVYPRSDGTVYLCGGADSTRSNERLPASPSLVVPVDSVCENLVSHATRLNPIIFESATVMATQACWLPYTDSGPMIGKVGGFENVWIGTGNGVWGILNGPATGLAVAELVLEG